MIIVKPKYHARKYCYGGSGIFDALLKNVINKAANSAVVHKVMDSVVNGATSATQKAVENTVTDLLSKRKAPPPATGGSVKKKLKVDISNLINKGGSGIVLD